MSEVVLLVTVEACLRVVLQSLSVALVATRIGEVSSSRFRKGRSTAVSTLTTRSKRATEIENGLTSKLNRHADPGALLTGAEFNVAEIAFFRRAND